MKQLITIVTALFAINSFSQTTIKTEPFSKITLESSGKVILRPDTFDGISYEGNDNPDITKLVKNNTLKIAQDFEDEIVVHFRELNTVLLEGDGAVYGESQIKTDVLYVKVNGSGKVTMNVEANKVNAEIQGLGKIVLNGTAQEANFSIPGAGKIDAENLRTINCNANISGLGKCIVDPIDVLNANISGNGNIVYKTTPKQLNKRIEGLGSVKSLGGGSDDSGNSGNSNDHGNYIVHSDGKDTTKIDMGKNQLWIIGDKDSLKTKYHKKKSVRPIWAGFEYGLNTYMDNGGTFTLDPGKENFELKVEKSEYVAINFLQKHTELGNSNIWLVSGLGLSWNNYRFDSDIILDNGDYITAHHDTNDVEHIKSKLVAVYLNAPVMFEVFTSHKFKNAFHLGVGGMFGLRIDSYTKLKFENEGATTKTHTHDDYNLNTFRYGFRVAVGYGHFNLFADYYASTLFKDNKGPVLYPFSAGITVIGF
jgi:hypothetical protein